MKVISGLQAAITARLDRAGKWWRNTFLHKIVLTERKVYRQKALSSPVLVKYGVMVNCSYLYPFSLFNFYSPTRIEVKFMLVVMSMCNT